MKAAETPLMKQYYNIKAKHPDAILLFRVGDFYETFEEDAVKASGILGITLTKRANGAASYIDLAGFPHHALDTYLPKLVRAGQRVAICEQLEDPKMTKTIVKRGVITSYSIHYTKLYDKDLMRVEGMKEIVTHAVCLDSADPEAVKSLPLKNADVVVVCIGENEGANIMATALMKKNNVNRLISRSISPLHETVLEAMGVSYNFV